MANGPRGGGRRGGGDQAPGRPVRRSRRPDPERPDQRRSAVAAEAARLMQDHGITDYHAAKSRAAERLGFGRGVPLPDNEEIAAARAERNRIFRAESQPEILYALRQTALAVMDLLEPFAPRLVGDVLSGIAGDHAGVELHAFSETPEAVADTLAAAGIAVRAVERRCRFRRGETVALPACRLVYEDCDVIVTVFPPRLRGQAPLSPVDGRPMKRASAREVAGLLEQGVPDG